MNKKLKCNLTDLYCTKIVSDNFKIEKVVLPENHLLFDYHILTSEEGMGLDEKVFLIRHGTKEQIEELYKLKYYDFDQYQISYVLENSVLIKNEKDYSVALILTLIIVYFSITTINFLLK